LGPAIRDYGQNGESIRTKVKYAKMFLALGLSVAAGAVGATGVTLAKHGPEALVRIFDKQEVW
jgi:hypothetical protein